MGWALAAAVISGVAVFVNGLVVKGIDPLVHTTIKNAMVGLMILGVVMLTRNRQAVGKLGRKQWLKLVGIAVIGGSLAFALFFTGLKQIGATEGQILNKTMVIWVALMAAPLLGEKLSKRTILGILLIYASSLVGGSWKSSSLLTGHLMVIGGDLALGGREYFGEKDCEGSAGEYSGGSKDGNRVFDFDCDVVFNRQSTVGGEIVSDSVGIIIDRRANYVWLRNELVQGSILSTGHFGSFHLDRSSDCNQYFK